MNARTPLLSRDQVNQLADEIAEASAYIDAATHRLLTGIRRFDEAEGWGTQGALSCAHWLSWRVGLGLGVAREKVRVARRLGELALVDQALSRGEVSYSKVRAITRVATADHEATLLEMARCSTAAQLEIGPTTPGLEPTPQPPSSSKPIVRSAGTLPTMSRLPTAGVGSMSAALMTAWSA
jgi:hypothetical protein